MLLYIHRDHTDYKGHGAHDGQRVQELCESRGGHPGLPVPNKPYGCCRRKVTFGEEGLAPLLFTQLLSSESYLLIS